VEGKSEGGRFDARQLFGDAAEEFFVDGVREHVFDFVGRVAARRRQKVVEGVLDGLVRVVVDGALCDFKTRGVCCAAEQLDAVDIGRLDTVVAPERQRLLRRVVAPAGHPADVAHAQAERSVASSTCTEHGELGC